MNAQDHFDAWVADFDLFVTVLALGERPQLVAGMEVGAFLLALDGIPGCDRPLAATTRVCLERIGGEGSFVPTTYSPAARFLYDHLEREHSRDAGAPAPPTPIGRFRNAVATVALSVYYWGLRSPRNGAADRAEYIRVLTLTVAYQAAWAARHGIDFRTFVPEVYAAFDEIEETA